MNTHTRMVAAGAGILIIVLAAAAAFFGPRLWDQFDTTSFHWGHAQPADSEAVISGDVLVLVASRAHPEWPILAAADFSTRTLTPLMDLTASGTGVSSARVSPAGNRIVVNTLDTSGLSRVFITDVRGHVITGPLSDAGDRSFIRHGADWSPTGMQMTTGLLPTALYGSAQAEDPAQWGVYLSNSLTPLKVFIAQGFNPAFSADGKSLFMLTANGIGAVSIPDNGVPVVVASSTLEVPKPSVIAAYPDGMRPAAFILSQDRRTGALSYFDSNRVDVYAVSGDPAQLSLLRTVEKAEVRTPFSGAPSYAAAGDARSIEAAEAGDGRVELTLRTAAGEAQTLRLPRGIVRVSIAELLDGSLVQP